MKYKSEIIDEFIEEASCGYIDYEWRQIEPQIRAILKQPGYDIFVYRCKLKLYDDYDVEDALSFGEFRDKPLTITPIKYISYWEGVKYVFVVAENKVKYAKNKNRLSYKDFCRGLKGTIPENVTLAGEK